MKKLVLLLLAFAGLAFTGCTGVVSGHKYTKDDLVMGYTIVKNGVKTFVPKEKIEEFQLDKADSIIVHTYNVVEKKQVDVTTDLTPTK